MEVARVELRGREVHAEGTQLGVAYELRYRLAPGLLRLAIDGGRAVEVELGDADYFDLGWSPLFNSLPVLRDGLLADGAGPREYTMRWVDVPALGVRRSEQRYEPLGGARIRYSSESFSADTAATSRRTSRPRSAATSRRCRCGSPRRRRTADRAAGSPRAP